MESTRIPRILFVDDELDLLDLFSKRLKRAGFEVTVASNGRGAIEFLGTQTFDAVVCDINMPGGVNGFDVFEYIHSKFPERLPFIFVTGHGEGTPEMTRALSLGVEGVYSKPISSKILINHLQRICGLPVTD